MKLNREAIKELLPQREPFLFLDEVIELEKGRRIKASYTFPATAEVFKGHFPDKPVVPGVLLIEAMAQAGGVLSYVTDGLSWREKGAMLLRVDKALFRKPVMPGERIVIETEFERRRDRTSKIKGRIMVDEKCCAEAVIMATYTEPFIK